MTRTSAALDIAPIVSAGSVVRVALIASRWEAEMGRGAEAGHLLERAERATEGSSGATREGRRLRGACLDARADLLLDVNRRQSLGEVDRLAGEAVVLAGSVGDLQVTTQAHTTLAVARLMRGDLPSAGIHIEAAARYRASYRSLLVLALQGVLARMSDQQVRSRDLFGRLLDEATGRSNRNGEDFAAFHFKGLAQCGLCGPSSSLEEAQATFEVACRLAPHVPGLVNRLKFFVECLEPAGSPERFAPIVQVLEQAVH